MKKFLLTLITLLLMTCISANKTFAVPCADGSSCHITNISYNPCVGCGGTVYFNWTVCDAAPGSVLQFSISYTGGGVFGSSFVFAPVGGCQSGTGSAFIGNLKTNVVVEIMNTSLGFCQVPVNLALPVELNSFEAISISNINTLKWTTAQELNLSGFEIEKSIDGRVFERVGFVPAAASPGEKHDYTWQDMGTADASAFYRLKMLDADGQFRYSKIEKIIRNTVNEISVYPNPCSMTLNISLPENADLSTVEICSLDGRKIISQKTNSALLKIDIESLTKGTYMLRVYNDEKRFTTKFIRQ